MFGTIRRHQTWLWVVIIAFTVVAFVVYFSPYSKLNTGSQREVSLGAIDGKEVTRDRYVAADREVALRHFLMSGQWPDQDRRRTDMERMREVYQWLLFTQKADDLGIQPGTEAIDQQARQILKQLSGAGVASASQFFKQVLEPRGLGPADFERFIRHTLAVQELVGVVGASGKLVTPDEARALYIRQNQEVAVEALFFNATNFLDKVTITPEALSQFYSNRLAAYRIPDRVQVSYVKFPLTNFLESAKSNLSTNLEDIVTANMQRMGTNLYRNATTPEESRARLREDIIKSQALSLARKEAANFAVPLFEIKPMKAENLEQFAKEKNLPVAVTPPFSREADPEGIDAGPDFARVAFSLGEEEPLGGPIVAEDGVYVVALQKKIPSEAPALDQIRDQVTRDFRQFQATSLARAAGTEAHTALTNALAQGKSFADAAAQAGLKPVSLPPFSIATRSLPEVSQLPINQLKQIAFSLDPGKLGNFQPTAGGGVIAFLKEKLPVNEEKLKSELPTFVESVRRSRQDEAFSDWFRKLAEKAFVNTPLNQPEPSSIAPGTAKS